MYQSIIWDLDGTLFDTYPNIINAVLQALREEGIEESYDTLLGMAKSSSLITALEYCKSKYNITEAVFRRYDEIEKSTDPGNIRLFPYVKEICKSICEAGKKNYLFTHRGLDALDLMKYHGIYEYFKDFVTGESGFQRKPDPGAILYLIDKYHMKPKEALMVGDRVIDILSAKNASIDACYFWQPPNGKVEEADYTITSIEELGRIIPL